MSLVEHAVAEMRSVGLYDNDSDYAGMLGKAVEDLDSHEDYQEWVGEIHVRRRLLSELDTLEHIVYERS